MRVPIKKLSGAVTGDAHSALYSYSYNDSRKRLTSITVNLTGPARNEQVAQIEYEYDANDRVTAVRTDKSTTLYQYDAAGQLTALYNLSADNQLDPFEASGYGFTEPDGTDHTVLSKFTNIKYNARGQLYSMQAAALHTLGIGVPSTYVTYSIGFGYDAAGRLVSETYNGTTRYHSYDAGGNITALRATTQGTPNWGAPNTDVDQTPGPLSLPQSLQYLSRLGMTTVGSLGHQFSYNAQGQLAKAVGDAPDWSGSFTLLQDFRYDASGRRVYQSFPSPVSGTHEETYLYDGSNMVARWAKPETTETAGIYHVSDISTSDSDNPDAHVLYVWGPTGLVMEFDSGKGTADSARSRSFLFDPMGNCLNTTLNSGIPARNYLSDKPVFYDGYGQPVSNDSAIDELQRLRRQPFQYKGQAGYYSDVHTGLIYCWNRYYDPTLGRWTTRDPIGLEGGVNVYAYCDGDPVSRVDPSGLDWDWSWIKWRPSFRPPDLGLRWWFSLQPNTRNDTVAIYDATNFWPSVMGGWGWALGNLGDFLIGKNATKTLTFDRGTLVSDLMKSSLSGQEIRKSLPRFPYEGQVVKGGIKTEPAFFFTVEDFVNGPQAFIGAYTYRAEYRYGGWNVELANTTGLNSLMYHQTAPRGIKDPKSGPLGATYQIIRYRF